jgi:predicted Zn-dependent peptidase
MAGMKVEPELIELENGVRIALDPMPGLETTALGVYVRVGARWERPEENGIAHLFEHMAFKGAGGRDATEFAEAIENVGGFVNASTSYERTTYTARVVKEQAGFALGLLADMMFEPHWDAEELEKEKGVVAQERAEAFDQPDDRVFELHQSGVFKDQALGRPILGAAETVQAVSVKDLRAFRDRHTTGSRLVISVAGGYNKRDILKIAEQRFGAVGATKKTSAPRAKAHAMGSAEARRTEQAHVVLSCGGVAQSSEDGPSFWALSEILGGGMASRLFQEVREKRGLVYAINSWTESYEDVGRLGIYAGCSAKNAKEVANCVNDALEALAESGPTEAEMTRAKAIVSAQMLMGAEAPSARCDSRANQVFRKGRIIPYMEIKDKLLAVTAADVRKSAQVALKGPRAAAVIGPKAAHNAVRVFAPTA